MHNKLFIRWLKNTTQEYSPKNVFLDGKVFFECMKRHEIVTRCWRIEKNVNELENFPCSNQNPLELLYPRERCHRAFHLTKRKKKKKIWKLFISLRNYTWTFAPFFIITLPKFILRLLFSQQRLISVLTSLPWTVSIYPKILCKRAKST